METCKIVDLFWHPVKGFLRDFSNSAGNQWPHATQHGSTQSAVALGRHPSSGSHPPPPRSSSAQGSQVNALWVSFPPKSTL